jgi:hypothetical protein
MFPDIAKLTAKFDRMLTAIERMCFLMEQMNARDQQRDKAKDCVSE